MMTDKTAKALDNFAGAHASDGPAGNEKPKEQPKAEKAVKEATSGDQNKGRLTEKAIHEDARLNAAYENGRLAKQRAIAKEDAPHDNESDEYKAWLKGWDYQDKL